MFIVDPKHTRAEIREQAEMDAVVRDLSTRGYRPLFRSVLATMAQAAELPQGAASTSLLINEEAAFRLRPSADRLVVGEIFFRERAAFFVQPIGDRLHVWEVRRHDAPGSCDAVCKDVEAAIRRAIDGRRVRGMQFTWKPAVVQARQRTVTRHLLHDVRLETKRPGYSQEELVGASVLADTSVRALLLRLAQLGKARPSDPSITGDSDLLSRVLEAHLVRQEYLVSCRQDSRTLVVIPDKAQLAAMPPTMRCYVCGRAFDGELVQEIYSVSELGRRLLSGSHWMTVWVTWLLQEAGVPESAIAWNAASGQDELDIIVETVGLKVFFELKDREFGLGDAYPFVARVNRYGGTSGIIITTDRLAEESKRFLDEQRQTGASVSVSTIEGAAQIRPQLFALIQRLSRVAVRSILRDMVASVGIGTLQLMDRWMVEVEKLPVTALKPVTAPPEDAVPVTQPALESRPTDGRSLEEQGSRVPEGLG